MCPEGTLRRLLTNLFLSCPDATFDDDHSTTTSLTFTVENTAPAISFVGITTEDRDADGKIESALVVFTEAIDDSTLVAEDFSIGGNKPDSFDTLATSSINSSGDGAADDNTIRLLLNTGIGTPVVGTAAQTVTYTAGTSTVKDIGGNALANFSVTSIDGARPNITSVESVGSNPSGVASIPSRTLDEPLRAERRARARAYSTGSRLHSDDAYSMRTSMAVASASGVS